MTHHDTTKFNAAIAKRTRKANRPKGFAPVTDTKLWPVTFTEPTPQIVETETKP